MSGIGSSGEAGRRGPRALGAASGQGSWQLPRRARMVAVIGARGGAGASVLAAALARAAAERSCLLLDADPLGGGVDLLLGAEDEPGLRWPELITARGRLHPDTLTAGLPAIDGLRVLTWDRRAEPGGAEVEVPAPAMEAVLAAAGAEFGAVVVDLPRRLDPAARVAARAADVVLLVTPAEVRAVAAARRVAITLSGLCPDVRLVVRGPSPAGLDAAGVAAGLRIRLEAVLRPEPGLAAMLDRGEPPGLRRRGPLAVLSRRLAGEHFADPEPIRNRARGGSGHDPS